jgi:hypothetical protein
MFHKFAAAIYPIAPSENGDAGSANANPNFTSATDLTFSSATPARGSGIPVISPPITTDISGAARNAAFPCIGAVETSQTQSDKTPPVISDLQIVSGVSPSVSIALKDNSQAASNATVRLWYRPNGGSGSYTGIDADSKPGGPVMNGSYIWNTSLASLSNGSYEFYIVVRDNQGAGTGIWTTPMWNTYWVTFNASDPPNFNTNPSSLIDKRWTFIKTTAFGAGTYTVGFGENYPDLTAVADTLLNSSHTGSSIFELTDNYTGEGSTPSTIEFKNIVGTSESVTITIRPAATVTRVDTTQFDPGSGNPLIKLNGVSHMVFDGRPGGSGATVSWIVRNTRRVTPGPTVQFINDACHDTIRYMSLEGIQASVTAGIVQIGTADMTGNSYNLISNCEIRFPANGGGAMWPYVGVYAYGTSGRENRFNKFDGNKFNGIWSSSSDDYGMNIGPCNSDWTISNNHFFNAAVRNPSAGATHYGIYISAASAINMSITGNYIGGTDVFCGGGPYIVIGNYASLFRGIYVLSSSTTGLSSPVSIQNNTIANFDWWTTSNMSSTPGVWSGIHIAGGNANIGTLAGNTIGSGSDTQSIKIGSASSGGVSSGITVSSSEAIANISNNTIGSIELRGYTAPTPATCSHSFNGIWIGACQHVKIIDNLIGSTTAAKSISLNDTTASNSVNNQSFKGIYVTSAATDTVSDNTIANIYNNYSYTSGALSGNSIAGVYVSSGDATITGNTIRNLTTTSTAYSTGANAGAIGLYVYNTSCIHNVAGNSVAGLKNTGTRIGTSVTGLYFGASSSGTSVIESNDIHGLGLDTANSNSRITGIEISNGSTICRNNMISVGVDDTGSTVNGASICGIKDTSMTGANDFYYNSAYVGGATDSVSSKSYAFISYDVDYSRSYKNNIFYNARSGGQSSKHYAYCVGGTGINPWGLSSDYNILYASGSTGGTLGSYDGADYSTLSAWRTATGQDASSISYDPLFINPAGAAFESSLHINSGTGLDPIPPGSNAGTYVSDAAGDFDGAARSTLHPDIGADEHDVNRYITGAGPFGFPSGRIDSLSMDAAGQTMSLTGGLFIDGALALTNGILIMGSFNMTLGPSVSMGGTYSSTNMIVADGTGELRKAFSGTGSFTFHIGDNTGTAEYSPLTIDMTAGTFGSASYAGVRVTDSKHPDNPSQSDYLTRYWTITSSDISSFSCGVSATYNLADVVGSSGNMKTGKWNGVLWTRYAAADTINSRITATGVTDFSDFTAGSEQAMKARVTVNSRAFLEGPFNGSSAMNTYLIPDPTDTATVMLPLVHPYGAGYGGSVSHRGAENVESLAWFNQHPDIVDWVMVELRASDGMTTEQTRAAFIDSGGYIVDLDGVSPVTFDSVLAGGHYIVLRHRNHLAVMSADTVHLYINSSLYDFSTNLLNIYGNNAKTLGGLGIYGMYSGDGNSDGGVDTSDRINIWLPENGSSGYMYGDFNMDGGIDTTDRIDFWLPNNGSSTQVP